MIHYHLPYGKQVYMKQKSFQALARQVLLYTAIFSLLAHGYRYLSLSFSGDAMLLSQVGEEAYQASLGRFLQPVYWQIRGYITAPLLIGLFATAFLAASALIVVHLLRLERPLHIALVCGVLTANETMALSNAAYLPWTDVYALALLLALLGVYAFFEMRRGWLIAPVFYILSTGLYQSYLPVASTMVILILMLRTLSGENAGNIWKQGIVAVLTLLASLLIYAGLLNLILSFGGINASSDYNGVARVGHIDDGALPMLTYLTYMTPIQVLFSLSDRVIMRWHITTVPQELNLAIFIPCALLILMKVRKLRLTGFLTLLFLIGVLPFGMNFVEFLSHGIASGLTIYSYNLLYLLPIAFHAQGEESCRLLRLPSRVLHFASLACLCMFLLLNIRTSNELVLKRDLEFSATTAAMSRILDQAEQTEGYVPGETPVVLVGMLPSSAISMERPGFEELARAQGMRYTYGASYETANYWYLQMMLGEPIHLVSHEERMKLSETEFAQNMPAFPKEGYCAMADGYLYIRFH